MFGCVVFRLFVCCLIACLFVCLFVVAMCRCLLLAWIVLACVFFSCCVFSVVGLPVCVMSCSCVLYVVVVFVCCCCLLFLVFDWLRVSRLCLLFAGFFIYIYVYRCGALLF